MDQTTDVRLLRQLFFRRFFDNDLVAPSGGGEQKVGLLYAGLMVPGLLVTAPLLLKYMNPYLSPGGRLLRALDDTVLGLSISLIVTAMATVLSWDSLTLDARDVAVLGPLPVTRRALVTSKLQAIGAFVGTVLVAVNLIPSVLFPPILLGTLQVSVARIAWLVVARALVSAGAGMFGFFAVLACRQTTSMILGSALARRLSAVLQSTLLLALVTAFLLLPTLPGVSKAASTSETGLPWLGPAGWFLGLHEVLTNWVVLDAPVAPLGKIRVVPIDAEGNRRRYLAHLAEFERLARTGGLAFAVVTVLAVFGYAVELRRAALRVEPTRLAPHWLTRYAAGLAETVVVRHPLARATFFFTLQTLVRAPSQRLYLATGLAMGCAGLVVLLPGGGLGGLLRSSAEPVLGLISLQTFLVCTLAGTLRLVAVVPAELRANWTFRVALVREPRPAVAGVRRAAFVAATVLLSVLLPVHAHAWGLPLATVHLMFGLLASVVAVEWLFRDLRFVPFTCSADATQFRALVFRTATFVVLATAVLGNLECWGLKSPGRARVAVGLVGLLVVGLAIWRERRVRACEALVYEEPLTLPTQRLGLSGTD